MKKPASDQMFHDRRYQERKREAAKRTVKKTDEVKTPQDASRKQKGVEEETS
jgi:hypothetical protein